MKIYLIVFYIILFCYNVYAGDADSLLLVKNTKVKVDSIDIRGNDITEDFIIRRELTFSIGDTVDEKLLEFNRQRIYSLGLFNHVEVFAEKNDERTDIVINVSESWYIYPIPFLKIQAGDFKKASYGMNFLYKNFRGRNETIRAILSFGYDPSITLSYFNPVIFSKDDISFSSGTTYQAIQNKSITAENLHGGQFDYLFYTFNFGFGKRINHYNSVFISTGFRYVEAPVFVEGITASDSRIDRNLSLGVSYNYDSRDLKQHPENGILTSAEYAHQGFGINSISYNILRLDFREYRKLFHKFTIKWRVTYRHTFGKVIPFYDYSFFGFREFIRGHKRDAREGNNYFLGSVELSHPLLQDWLVSMKLPLLPRRLTTARVDLYFSIFIDTGLTYNNGETWNIRNFDSGWGVGLTILALPFNAVRFEYAFNENGKGEFILGTGFSF